MTEEERRLVTELFDRLGTLEDAQRDSEAERLIREGLRQAPNAPYALVQTVLVQDEALKRANARIRELEGGGAAPQRDTSFLGSMRDTLLGPRDRRPSVPSVGPSPTPSGISSSGMSSAWRSTAQPMAAAPAGASYQPGAPVGMGGSFLGTAASAAAGVIGGALLLDGIRSMMGHHGGAHAALDPGGASPWSGDSTGGDLSRQAGLDDIGRTSDVHRAGLFDDTADDRAVDRAYDSSDNDSNDADFTDDGGFGLDDDGSQDV